MSTDIISRTFDGYFTWAHDLSTVYFHGLILTGLVFGLPAILTAAAFARNNRSVFTQVICCVVGLLTAATIPLERLEFHNRFVRGWIIALTVVVLLFLPRILAFLLVPNLGAQRKVRWVLYALLAGLLIAVLAQPGVTP